MNWDLTAKPSPYGKTSPAPAWEPTIAVRVGASPDATAFAFGAMLQREYGKEWPRLIGIAAGAAMRAERDALELKQDKPGGGE